METKSNSKSDVIMAGLGGMGVLMAGKILALAVLEKYKYVSWFPSYGVEKRGGLCDCTVLFSNNEISSPLLDQSQTVIVFTGSQFASFESRVLPGGIIVTDSTDYKDDRKRTDYELVKIPAIDLAVDSKVGLQSSNMILLGAYVGITDSVPNKLVEDELKRKFAGKEKILKLNQDAFQIGIEYIKKHK